MTTPVAGIVKALVGLVAAAASGNENEARKVTRQHATHKTTLAVATNTAIAEQVAVRAKQKCRLVACHFTPGAAITGTATDFFTLLIDLRRAALPGTPVNLITFAADTPTDDNVAAFASKDLMTTTYAVGAGADFDLEEGDVLTFEVTKSTATGMTYPISSVHFELEPRT